MQINIKNGKRAMKLTQTELRTLDNAAELLTSIGMMFDTKDAQTGLLRVRSAFSDDGTQKAIKIPATPNAGETDAKAAVK